MKQRNFMKFALTCALCFLALRVSAQSALKLPAYQKTKLPNGLTVILMRQTEVPLVSFNVGIRAGAINDPAGKEGVSSVTVEMSRRGEKRAAPISFRRIGFCRRQHPSMPARIFCGATGF
ncbi:MAG: hypothetical protein U0Y68_14325 [Blastocatellia bacterium]